MTREAKENQIISELYSKINEADELPGVNAINSPQLADNSARPVGSLEVYDATVRLMGSQLMIDTHYGSAVVVLDEFQHAGLTKDWADLAKQDKSVEPHPQQNAIDAGEAAQRRAHPDRLSFDQQQHQDFEPELPE